MLRSLATNALVAVLLGLMAVLICSRAMVESAPVSGTGLASDGVFFTNMATAYGLSRDDVEFKWTSAPTTASAFDSYFDESLIYFATHGSLDSELTAQGELAQVPLAGGALVAVYNIGTNASLGATAQLSLDGQTLARIWSGDISRWNDAAVAALNPYLASNGLLPDADILLAFTDDAAGGLGVAFLRYVCSVLQPGSLSTCLASGFPGMTPAARSSAFTSSTLRAAYVRSTPNSLTYLGLAEATGMNVAAFTKGSTRLQPTAASITAAMTDSTELFNNLTAIITPDGEQKPVLNLMTATSAGSWPMTYLVYGTFFAESNNSLQCVLLNEYVLWISWMLLNDNAATSASAALHPIIPYDWKRTVLDGLSSVTCLGKQVSSSSYLVGMGSSNPLPTLGRYYPASRFVLKYFIGNTDASVLSLVQGTIDFGQTSAPVTAQRMAQAPDIMTVPVWCWGISPAYHLPELIGSGIKLKMDWNVVSDIYLGHVTMWNDPKIGDLNPEIAGLLPNRTIRIVYQSNRSTISLVFNTAISSRVVEYNNTIGPVNHFDNSVAAQSSRGIPVNGFAYPEAINANAYSFGLCSSQHLNRRVQPVAIMNTAGNWVTPTPESVLAAIEDYQAELDRITFYHAPGPQSWPIALLTAVTVRSRTMTDCAKAAVLVDWLYWMQTSEVGRDIIDSSNYVAAYPFDGFLNVLRQKLVNVTCRGVAVSSLVNCVDSDGRLCSERGVCDKGACVCQAGWTGDLCQEVVSSAGNSDSSQTVAIVLGVSLPVIALILCAAVAALVLVALLRRGNDRHNREYFINVAELDMGAQLGQGGFGEVYKATWKGTEVAVKLMPESAASSKEARESFADEVAIMSTLRHPNVVLFMAACTKPPKLCIVMEYMALGSLYDLLHNELVPEIPLALKLRMAHQAAKGMHFLHASDIVHRDLKSLNLLLDNKWNVKVADFGLTKFRDSVKHKGDSAPVVGSVPWMAPEVLQEELDIDFRLADIYSFAIVMWELLTRDQPYMGMAPPQVAVLVITNDLRPHAPNDLHLSEGERAFARLMTKCWQRDAPMRPDFIEIMQTLVEIGNTHAGASSGLFGTTNTSSSSGSSNPPHHSSSYLSSAHFGHSKRSGGGSSSAGKSGYSSTSSTQSAGGAMPRLKAVPRRDVSFVVCDLAEFDRVWQSNPSEADRAIELYGAIVRRRCGEHMGHVFSLPSLHSGGTFMISFADPAAVVRFVLAVRRDVMARNNARLDASWRVSIDHRPGTCLAPPEDHTRTGYEARDYAGACTLNMRCPLGGILCSSAFAQRLGQAGSAATSLVRLINRTDGASCRVLDASDADLDAQASAAEEDEQAGGDHDGDGEDGDGSFHGDARLPSRRSGGEETGICSSNACHWIINTERIKLGDVIGEGNYGKVTEGNYFGTQVAIKRLFNGRLDDDGMRRMRKEAAILSNLDHPNIVKLIGLSITDGNLSLVMELVPRGSLRSVLSSNVSLPWNKRLSMLRDAALGIEFLHSHGVLHRDIKSSNLLVDDNWSVKVGDFGFATAKHDNATMTRCGTPCWTAPEILCPPQPADVTQPPTKATYTEAADVYSFGIVMWEVLTRKTPYSEGNMMTVVSDVMGGKRPRLPTDCPQAFAALVQRCWHRKASKRPSMNEVLLHLNSELDSIPL